MATIHTKNATVYLASSAGAASVITEAADVSFDVDFDLAQDNAFGDTWMTQLRGFSKWKGQIAGNFDTAASQMFDAAVNATAPLAMYVYANRTGAGSLAYYYGTVWPKLGVSMPIGVGKFTIPFEGDGALALKP